ncbi:SOS response regulatory protein OraA/RecX [Actinokineospora cianjurensis]|uniref:Regulatory protein RecX n=1 Tax=Actinokineospora cianjurensis TaxID=585224 RepID=A0A421BAX5_9PSEU|nr:SOS response regulatory protein OraA/RecX [Actinokineospora cianjurensis]
MPEDTPRSEGAGWWREPDPGAEADPAPGAWWSADPAERAGRVEQSPFVESPSADPGWAVEPGPPVESERLAESGWPVEQGRPVESGPSGEFGRSAAPGDTWWGDSGAEPARPDPTGSTEGGAPDRGAESGDWWAEGAPAPAGPRGEQAWWSGGSAAPTRRKPGKAKRQKPTAPDRSTVDGPAATVGAAPAVERQSAPDLAELRRQVDAVTRERGEREQEKPDRDDLAAKARDICYRQLAARDRTRVELAQALRRKEIPDDIAEAVLGKFDAAGLINDAAFAESWVRSRHTHRGLGRRALATELRRKGVDDEIVAEAVAAVDTDAEQERAAELVAKKLGTMRALDEQTKIRRLVAVLARRGYGEGLAYRVVRAALDAAEPLD